MRHQLATVTLGPLLLWQGLGVRRRIPKLPEAAGPRSGKLGAGPALRVLILGDSAAAGVGAAHQDAALAGQLAATLAPAFRVEWHLLARTGVTTQAMLHELDECATREFDVAVTSLGVNDVTHAVGLARWRRQQAQLRARLCDELGVAQVLISALPPMREFPALPQPLRWYLGARAQQFNRALRQDIASDGRCEFLPFDVERDPAMMAADGFHPGPRAYTAWAELAAARIRTRWA